MHRTLASSSLLLALVVSPCSGDSPSGMVPRGSGGATDTSVGANQPGAGGTSAAPGAAGGSNAGGAEGTNPNIGLNQGGSTSGGTPGGAAAGTGGSAAVP